LPDAHEVAAQPQSAAQLWWVSPASQVPSPQTGPPHSPHHEQASAQQSPWVTQLASQKQPAGAAPLAHAFAWQPQSLGQLESSSPGSQLPSLQAGPLHTSHAVHASGQQSPLWRHA
jgi:hypothetical protein